MDILKDKVNSFFLQSVLNGLELRQGQLEMVTEVSEAIEKNLPFAAEAEVGIGKSYAYLISVVIKYSADRRQIVIATSTIALQEQLYSDIQNVMRMLAISTDVIVAKGMKNYVCRRRLQGVMKRNDSVLLNKIMADVQCGIQDRAEMQFNIPAWLWDKICISRYGSEYCHTCDFTESCEYRQLRKKALFGSNIVICNQNMLVSHFVLQARGVGIFNRTCAVYIIDEAHDIESKFRDAFSVSFSRKDMINIVNRLADTVPYQQKKLAQTLVKNIGITIQKLYKEFVRQVHKQQKEIDDDKNAYYFDRNKECVSCLAELLQKLERFERFTCVSTAELCGFIDTVLNGSNGNVMWIEDGENIRLCVCRNDIRNDISRLLFGCGNVIMTSATISDKSEGTPHERCKFFLESIGFPKYCRVSKPKKSPFDYEHNSILYVSAAMPIPKYDDKDEYRDASIEEIIKLLSITKGKTLILFTSKKDMEYVYKKLSNAHLPYKFLIQHSGSSQAFVLEKFRKNLNSVILGTGTFWDGINVVGKSLSQVIIYKLPFPAPDPVTDYKMSVADDSLLDVAVPEMIIKLRQGVGRLIRSSHDKGIVSILDPRLSSVCVNRYRKITFDSLPMVRITEDMDILKKYWDKMCGGV